jgi:hypothetical protein
VAAEEDSAVTILAQDLEDFVYVLILNVKQKYLISQACPAMSRNALNAEQD